MVELSSRAVDEWRGEGPASETITVTEGTPTEIEMSLPTLPKSKAGAVPCSPPGDERNTNI